MFLTDYNYEQYNCFSSFCDMAGLLTKKPTRWFKQIQSNPCKAVAIHSPHIRQATTACADIDSGDRRFKAMLFKNQLHLSMSNWQLLITFCL